MTQGKERRQALVENAARTASRALIESVPDAAYAVAVRTGTSSGVMFNLEAPAVESATVVLDILRTFIQLLEPGEPRDQFVNYAHYVLGGGGPGREFSIRDATNNGASA